MYKKMQNCALLTTIKYEITTQLSQFKRCTSDQKHVLETDSSNVS